MKYVKSFPTTSALTAYLDGAENGYYLLRDESDTGATRIHYERVVNIPNFCIKAVSASTVSFNNTSRNLEYTLDDGVTWVAYTGGTITLNAGVKMYWRRTVDTVLRWEMLGKFSISGGVNVSGNIVSLLMPNFEGVTDLTAWVGEDYKGIFGELFANCAIISAEKLILPVTNMPMYIYRRLFYECRRLTTAPILYATTLSSYCYKDMFENCSSLTKIVSYANSVNTNQLYSWLSGASATGDFYNLGGATYTRGTSGIPNGWTEHTELD